MLGASVRADPRQVAPEAIGLPSFEKVAVLVRILGQKAILRDGQWRSANQDLERRLNHATDEWIRRTGGPPLDAPDPERAVAKHIAPLFGGKVALAVPSRNPAVRQMYVERRQMELFARQSV